MTKQQRDAVLRLITKKVKELTENKINELKKDIKLTNVEKKFVDLMSEYKRLDDLKNKLYTEINTLKENNKELRKFGWYNIDNVKDDIIETKAKKLLPKEYNIDYNFIEDSLILKDVRDFDIENFINDIIKDLT